MSSRADDAVLSTLVARHAAEQPNETAIDSVEDGLLSWRELRDAGLAWAGVLDRLGVQPGDCVLSMIATGHRAYTAWVGASMAGACDVHVNHALIGKSLSNVVATTGARVAFVGSELLEQWKPMLAEGLGFLVVVDPVPVDDERILSLNDLLEDSPPLAAEVPQSGDDLSCVIFTSGTTGNAKGVMLPWKAWSFAHLRAGAVPRELRRGKVPYIPFSLAHYSARFPFYAAMWDGTRVCTRRQFKTDRWLTDIREHGCQWTSLLGSMGGFLLNTEPQPEDDDNPLEFVVAAPVFPGVDRFKQRFGVDQVHTCYGQSEITVLFSSAGAYEVSEETIEFCGVPADSVDVKLVDERGADVEAGQAGEMIVRAREGVLSTGYLNNPEATAATYQNGWIHTGDLFTRTREGRYKFVDRMNDYLRRRGENISSFEVEREVLAHPGVFECAVYGVRSEYAEDEVMAAVVVDREHWESPADLLEFLQCRLPAFALPRFVEVFDKLPKTTTAKIRKALLRTRSTGADTWDRLEGQVRKGRRQGAETDRSRG
jgi:crotonobetaine/carnitine-CoA ligase